MTTSFAQRFAGLVPQQAPVSAPQGKGDKPETKLWLNVGYNSGVKDEHGEEVFISLPYGLGLDTMQRVDERSRNVQFSQIQQAKNALLDQLLKICEDLKPGETAEVPLTLQVRRVNEAVPVTGENPFANITLGTK